MLDKSFYDALQDRLGPVVGIAGGAAIVLHTMGYLSTRFHLRALGLEPDLNLVSEIYIFEGAELVIFLLTLLPYLIAAGFLAVGAAVVGEKIPGLRKGLENLRTFARGAPPKHAAALGALWGAVTVHFFMRHVLSFQDVVHSGVPCHPPWLSAVALSTGLESDLFFGLLILLPIPTLWTLRRLKDEATWKPAAALIGLVAAVQIILIPVHYGALVANRELPSVSGRQVSTSGQVAWQLFRSSDHTHILMRSPHTGQDFVVRVVPNAEFSTFNVESVDRLYPILTQDRACR
ncbi:MAG: hypothetical protein AAFY88_20420 [Acidobacteriota bacterium]